MNFRSIVLFSCIATIVMISEMMLTMCDKTAHGEIGAARLAVLASHLRKNPSADELAAYLTRSQQPVDHPIASPSPTIKDHGITPPSPSDKKHGVNSPSPKKRAGVLSFKSYSSVDELGNSLLLPRRQSSTNVGSPMTHCWMNRSFDGN